jgi:hypothetical protein
MKPLDGYDSPEVRALLEIHRPREWAPAVVGAVTSIFAAAALGLAAYFLIWRRRAPVKEQEVESGTLELPTVGGGPDGVVPTPPGPSRLAPTGTPDAELEVDRRERELPTSPVHSFPEIGSPPLPIGGEDNDQTGRLETPGDAVAGLGIK